MCVFVRHNFLFFLFDHYRPLMERDIACGAFRKGGGPREYHQHHRTRPTILVYSSFFTISLSFTILYLQIHKFHILQSFRDNKMPVSSTRSRCSRLLQPEPSSQAVEIACTPDAVLAVRRTKRNHHFINSNFRPTIPSSSWWRRERDG